MDAPDHPPRWLSEDEGQAWIALAGALMKVPAALDAGLQRESGLSYFEYAVLSWLSMQPERTTRMSELAELVSSSLSRLSHLARKLEKHGWLTRRPDPTDGRYTLATLTEDGWQKVQAAAPGHVETVRRVVFDPLTKAQVKQLREVAHRIQSSADEQTSRPT